jgi:SIR2-like domain
MILVFAGAGASKAVDPNQYPTTVEFFEKLPSDIRKENIFGLAVEYLKSSNKSSVIDIEQVLWTMAEVRDFVSHAANNKTVAGWFLEDNRLLRIMGAGGDVSTVGKVAESARLIIDRVTSRINEVVYELYAEPPSTKSLLGNWCRLLLDLMELREPIEIVTTNYDLIIEEAIAETKAPVKTGRTLGTLSILQQELWDLTTTPSNGGVGLLTKLHGSVDWIRGNNNRIHVGTPTYHGNHNKHAIIYPGFKGAPDDELFKHLHLYFEAAVAKADVIFFIGYGFRDEYINTIISRQIKPDCMVFVINPNPEPTTLSIVKADLYYKECGFDEDVITECLLDIDQLRRGVGA